MDESSALDEFAANGFTQKQLNAIAERPGLAKTFAGDRIDEIFKANVANDPQCAGLCITPRGAVGPDVYDPASFQWWDVTTPGQWYDHVVKYSGGYGTGNPLLYGGVIDDGTMGAQVLGSTASGASASGPAVPGAGVPGNSSPGVGGTIGGVTSPAQSSGDGP